ncbi:hypothetical protein FACS189472_05510 [Alphaproteobacteria bacterium]|nr:hypothetical protein FACS189472_05510 [Alphaproteobacteria bacterium]
MRIILLTVTGLLGLLAFGEGCEGMDDSSQGARNSFARGRGRTPVRKNLEMAQKGKSGSRKRSRSTSRKRSKSASPKRRQTPTGRNLVTNNLNLRKTARQPKQMYSEVMDEIRPGRVRQVEQPVSRYLEQPTSEVYMDLPRPVTPDLDHLGIGREKTEYRNSTYTAPKIVDLTPIGATADQGKAAIAITGNSPAGTELTSQTVDDIMTAYADDDKLPDVVAGIQSVVARGKLRQDKYNTTSQAVMVMNLCDNTSTLFDRLRMHRDSIETIEVLRRELKQPNCPDIITVAGKLEREKGYMGTWRSSVIFYATAIAKTLATLAEGPKIVGLLQTCKAEEATAEKKRVRLLGNKLTENGLEHEINATYEQDLKDALQKFKTDVEKIYYPRP